LVSARLDRKNAVSKLAWVCAQPEKSTAGRDFLEGLHRLAVLAQVDASGQHMHHAELVAIHHEFLIGRGQPAFHPARRVEHEIRAGMKGWNERLRAFIGRLGVGDLRGAQAAASPKRQAQPSRKLRRSIDCQRRLRRAEGGARPICMESVETKVPKMAAPGRTSCTKAIPANTSARTCVSVPATVTGLMAPRG
jgi:hypothetical protein